MTRITLAIALLLAAANAGEAAKPSHHHHHHDCDSCGSTEYRGYYRNSYGNVWEGDVDPGFGSERYGENGGTTHYGD